MDTFLKKEWNDDKCLEYALFEHIHDAVLDQDVQKNIINRFLNFYLGGKIPKPLSVTDVIFSVISIMPKSLKDETESWYIFIYHYSGDMFSLPDDDIKLAEKNAAEEGESSESEESVSEVSMDVTHEDTVTANEPGHSKSDNHVEADMEQDNTMNDCNQIRLSDQESGDLERKEELQIENINIIEKSDTNSNANVNVDVTAKENITVGHKYQCENTVTSQDTTKTVDGSESKIENKLQNEYFENFQQCENPGTVGIACDNIVKQIDSLSFENNAEKTNIIEDIHMDTENEHTEMSTENIAVDVCKINSTIENDFINTHAGPSKSSSESNFTGRHKQKNDIVTFPEKVFWLGNKKIPLQNKITKEYGPVENAAFINCCNKLLNEWDSNDTARIILKYFFGVVALTLMRSMTKSYKHVAAAFYSTFGDHIQRIKEQTNYNFDYVPPHKKCIDSSYRILKRREENSRVMLAKIVSYSENYLDNAFDYDELKQPFNIFRSALLSHIAGYKLELITMVQTLENRLSRRRLDIIIEVTHCEETEKSWDRVNRFLKKYMVPSVDEYTHHWARIIEESAFEDISCEENYALAVILALFIEKTMGNDGIWKAKWVEKGENIAVYKELALKMYNEYLVKDN